MLTKKIGMTAAALAAAGAIVAGGAAISNASTETAASPTASTAGQSLGYGMGYDSGAQGQRGPGGQGRHAHTAVTGDELAKVTAAVKAKDSGVTVTSVEKDPDGSYDVHGTKSGANVMVEVSKDLKTIEVRTGGPGQGGKGDSSAPGSSTQGSTQASPSSSAA